MLDSPVPLPPGVTLADVTYVFTGLGRGLNVPAGTPTAWLAPNYAKLRDLFDFECDCVNQYGDFRIDASNRPGDNRRVAERDLSGYVQLDFSTYLSGMPLRGNIGARYARTRTIASGFVGTNFVQVRNSYDDILPAFNIALEPSRDLVIRFAAAKVMARPQLQNLTPGGSINNTTRVLTSGNPFLKPIRAKTLDFNVEWYPDRDTQISIGLFYKDLATFIQSSITTLPFSETGLPESLLDARTPPDTVFSIQQATNTKGGGLKGIELAIQRPFTFLPSPLDGFGTIANFTYVKSNIDYITDSTTTPVSTIRLPLANLSKYSWNATLYYEKGAFGARISGAYRSGYIVGVPGGNGNNARGKLKSFTLDTAATLRVTDRATLTFQGLNLTDVFDNRFVDTERMNIEESTHTGRQFYVGLKYTL